MLEKNRQLFKQKPFNILENYKLFDEKLESFVIIEHFLLSLLCVCNLYVIHMCAWLSVLIKFFSYESENKIILIVANLLSIESRKKMFWIEYPMKNLQAPAHILKSPIPTRWYFNITRKSPFELNLVLLCHFWIDFRFCYLYFVLWVKIKRLNKN